ncbi:cyanamide hydratase, partial [Lichtheimia hyalospora FSU 10163]
MASQLQRELADSAVERDVDRMLRAHGFHPPNAIDIASIPVPNTEVAIKSAEYTHKELDATMWNHSNRAYYLGAVVATDQFPDWKVDLDTYYLTALFHDIGVAPRYHLSTSLSFEFWGGIHAREKLVEFGASQLQADEVAEAIIRHTDFVPGQIRKVGQLIQMGTTIDVIGRNPELYHADTIDAIVKKYPRLGFNCHFADLMDKECLHKPGSHTSAGDEINFIDRIRNNKVMEKYDTKSTL